MKEAKDLKLGDKIYALNPTSNAVHILFVDDILECMSDSNLLKIKYKNDYMKGEFKIYNNNKSYFNGRYCFYLDKNKVISELNDSIKDIKETINIIKDN